MDCSVFTVQEARAPTHFRAGTDVAHLPSLPSSVTRWVWCGQKGVGTSGRLRLAWRFVDY